MSINIMTSALFFLAAGIVVFLLFLNRVAINFKDGRPKMIFIGLLGIVLMVGSPLAGIYLGFSGWALLPGGMLFLICVGEIRRALIRKRTAGAKPTAITRVPLSLFRPLTHTDLNVLRYELRHPRWQGERLRIAHLSDLHVSADYPYEFYTRIRAHLEDADPDLLVMTGDFVTSVEDIPLLSDILRLLTTGFPAAAILGNHDYWADAERVAEAVQACGIDLLRHEYRRHAHYALCGDEGHWGQANTDIATLSQDTFTIALTHTPDNIYRLSDAGAQVVFAGHYHAGQFRLPYLGPVIVPSVYGRRFDHGHFVVHGTHLFITSGIGATVLPVRLFCQPDIFLVDIMGDRDYS